MWTDLSEDIAMGSQISFSVTHSWSVQGGPTILTTMTESDWTIVLQISRAPRSRRGDQGPGRPQAFGDLGGRRWPPRLTGGEASDIRNFEILLDLGPDIAPRGRSRTKDTFQSQSRRCPQTWNMSSHSIRENAPDDLRISRNYSTRHRHAFSKGSASSSGSRYYARETARNYASFVALVLGLILIKSVHTA